MTKKNNACEVDLSDSKFIGYEMDSNYQVTIRLLDWQENPVNITFKNTILFYFLTGAVPENLYVVENENEFLEMALKNEYGYLPSVHSFKYYQLVDIDDLPFVKIVAEDMLASKNLHAK